MTRPLFKEALNCALQLGNTTVYLDSGTYLTTASLQAGSWTSSPATINIVGSLLKNLAVYMFEGCKGQTSFIARGARGKAAAIGTAATGT